MERILETFKPRSLAGAHLDLEPARQKLERWTQGWVALSLCTTAHSLYTRFANMFGASISEAPVRPDLRWTQSSQTKFWESRKAFWADITYSRLRHSCEARGLNR